MSLATHRTGHGVLSYFNHLRRRLGQLGDLVHLDQATRFAPQIGVTCTA